MKKVLSVSVHSFDGTGTGAAGRSGFGQAVDGLDCESVEESGRPFDLSG
jgi:hypothetical protein